MRRPIPTGSRTTSPATNGSGARQCISWIDRFIEHTDNLESPTIWRKWAAISVIAAVLEQKVHVTTSKPLYPNLYIMLAGLAGAGKSRTIGAAVDIFRALPEMFMGPTSSTMAKLVDFMHDECKRKIIRMPDPIIEYNTLYFANSELSAFMPIWDLELIGGLTQFYDVEFYHRIRVSRDVDIKMERPQLNALIGGTPTNIMALIPEFAWEQGITSRIIMIYSDDRPLIDDFNTPTKSEPFGS